MSKKVEEMTFDEVLIDHLQNHAIPIHTTMVGACKLAIECINRGELNTMIELPSNVHFRRYSTWELEQSIEAFKVTIFCHLDEFLDENVKKDWEKFLAS
jgi:hypothetical protein